MMGHIIKSSKGSITEKLYKDLNKDIPLSQIDYMIKGYLEKDPHSNQYVMTIRQQSPSPSRQSRTQTKHAPNTQAQRARSISISRGTFQCYTCHKLGHTAKQCYFADYLRELPISRTH